LVVASYLGTQILALRFTRELLRELCRFQHHDSNQKDRWGNKDNCDGNYRDGRGQITPQKLTT
jgi:hypothetical protein